MLLMDKLPTVISCCFCCFLRAGTVMIAMFSFICGLIFAPNVANARGFWNMQPVLSNFSSMTENFIQMTLGIVSIMLCIISILLLLGSLCNVPKLIVVYQWGALIYSTVVFIMFFILAIFCFFIHSNAFLTGIVLCLLMMCDVLFTTYFIIVANSLRISLKLLNSGDLI